MPKYAEWLPFEEKTLIVEDCRFIEKINIWRDENYNLRIKVICSNVLIQENLSSDSIINKITQLKAHEYPLITSKYLIKGIIIESKNYTNGETSYSGKAVSIEMFWDNNIAGDAEYIVFWAVNSSSTINYDQSIQISRKEYENYSWGDFAKDNYNFGTEAASWNGIKLQYKTFNFLMVQVDSFVENLKRGTLFRFEKKQFPTEKEFYELLQIMMYVLGLEFVYIGYTMYNKKSSPVRSMFVSTFRLDLNKIINEIQLPPIPLRLEDRFTRIVNTTELVNDFILKFLEKKDQYQLFDVIGYVNYARSQPYNIKIQPLSTALDLLCSHYFQNKSNTLISKEEFKNISEKIKEIFSTVSLDKKIVKIFESKISALNNQSQNQRNKNIFKDLDLKLSPLEEKALNERNTAIHGSFNPCDVKEMIIVSNCYYTLINRLIIKLIGSPLYVDYSMQGRIINKVEDGQHGNYSVTEF